MRGKAAERAVRLPWLAAGAQALASLATADDPLDDPVVLADPAGLALVLRFATVNPDLTVRLAPPSRARLLRFAYRQLIAPPTGLASPNAVSVIARRANELAHGAKSVASAYGADVASATQFCAALTVLGEWALSTVEPDTAHSSDNADEVTRRLMLRWRMPSQLVAAVSYRRLPIEAAESLGADRRLIAALRVSPTANRDASPYSWVNPYSMPLLPDLLDMAARFHARRGDQLFDALESENCRLATALTEQHRGEDDRLHARKLSAIAEFAGGAGHEINTPLAIISGQSQYLLGREEDADAAKALNTIVQQTRRIHDILTELMQFARPPRPAPQLLDLSMVVREAIATMNDLAAGRDVKIDLELPESFLAFADPRHVRTVLQCLVRNAAEAAPAGGRVLLTGIQGNEGPLEIIVEDNGPGPDQEAAEHLFDPFYSGRAAGRGRGLGLPTAWRLAREQGGDVRYAPAADCPGRFILSLPRAQTVSDDERMTA